MEKRVKPRKTASGLDAFPRKHVPCHEGKSVEETGHNVAALVTSPAMAALRVVSAADSKAMSDTLDMPTLLEELRNQAQAINRGDLTRIEAMLMNQATALQTLFARLAERAMGNDNIAPFDVNMKMALRAQSQCRATLETLAAIKNPPIVYARQANIAQGHQQVNNGVLADPDSRTREEKPIQSNELLEAHDGERLVTGKKGTTGGIDQAMATVEQVNGAKNGRRKSAGIT